MAAEALAEGGARVDLYDAMPSVGRKFLLAGKGGLNLTHSDPPEIFVSRYGARADTLAPLLAAFGAPQLRALPTQPLSRHGAPTWPHWRTQPSRKPVNTSDLHAALAQWRKKK